MYRTRMPWGWRKPAWNTAYDEIEEVPINEPDMAPGSDSDSELDYVEDGDYNDDGSASVPIPRALKHTQDKIDKALNGEGLPDAVQEVYNHAVLLDHAVAKLQQFSITMGDEASILEARVEALETTPAAIAADESSRAIDELTARLETLEERFTAHLNQAPRRHLPATPQPRAPQPPPSARPGGFLRKWGFSTGQQWKGTDTTQQPRTSRNARRARRAGKYVSFE